jgi:Ca2+-binding RTX toxin-like protein
MTRVARSALAAAIAACAFAASAATATAAPYGIAVTGSTLEATAPAGTTLAVAVDEVGGSVEFVPGAASFPAGCSGTSAKTSCDPTLMATELKLAGDAVDVRVDVGAASKVTVTGGTESDSMSVVARGQAIELAPGAGNDAVTVTGILYSTLALTGSGDGDDRVRIDATPFFFASTLDLGSGNDVASTTSPNVTLNGAAGVDTLSGAGTLNGDAGNDLLQPTALGTSIDGGADSDRLSYAQLPAPATVAISRPSPTQVQVAGDAITKNGIEEIEGTPRNDALTGRPDTADRLYGGGGDDVLDGRGGSDILDGGPGFNTATYEFAPKPVVVTLDTGMATAAGIVDTLTAIRGIVTGDGNDVVTGSSADETITLGAGDDQVDGGDGNDTLRGGAGNDALRGSDGDDTLDGGAGTDTAEYDERTASEPVTVSLIGGGGGAAGEKDTTLGIENLTGGASSDTLTGDDGANVLLGGPGLNALDGLAGDDVIRGGEARDVISGGKGKDQLFGEGDDDSINAFDSEADLVSCGASLDDDAQVDAVDQVDGCEFASRGDVPVPVDKDGDGFVGGFDCDDSNKGISPAAVDIPGDKIDQDCDGFDEAVPFVEYAVERAFSALNARGRIVKQLAVTKLPADHRVLVICKASRRAVARRCPFTRRTVRPSTKTRKATLTPLFKRRRLLPGTVIELQITAPKFNGRVRRLTIRSGPTREQFLCLVAPRKTPQRCPEGDEE